MKLNQIIHLLIITAALPFAAAAQSITVTNASGGTTTINNQLQSFFGSVGGYFTSSNPNLPFKGTAEIALGMAYQSGVNIASDFDARAHKFALTPNSGVLLESVTRNAGMDGVIVSEQTGIGLLLHSGFDA